MLEKLRARLWYWAVRERSGLSDYQLDVHFGLYRPRAAPAPGKSRPAGDERRRVFEGIRVHGRDPTRIKNEGETIDLVAIADADPQFEGLERSYNAGIWWLVSAQPGLAEIAERLEVVASELGLRRISEGEQERLERAAADCLPERMFALCVQYSLMNKTFADKLSLLGLLYRHLDLCGELQFAEEVRALFDENCELFCYQVSALERHLGEHYEEFLLAVLDAPRPSQQFIPGSRHGVRLCILPHETFDDAGLLERVERLLNGKQVIAYPPIQIKKFA